MSSIFLTGVHRGVLRKEDFFSFLLFLQVSILPVPSKKHSWLPLSGCLASLLCQVLFMFSFLPSPSNTHRQIFHRGIWAPLSKHHYDLKQGTPPAGEALISGTLVTFLSWRVSRLKPDVIGLTDEAVDAWSQEKIVLPSKSSRWRDLVVFLVFQKKATNHLRATGPRQERLSSLSSNGSTWITAFEVVVLFGTEVTLRSEDAMR